MLSPTAWMRSREAKGGRRGKTTICSRTFYLLISAYYFEPRELRRAWCQDQSWGGRNSLSRELLGSVKTPIKKNYLSIANVEAFDHESTGGLKCENAFINQAFNLPVSLEELRCHHRVSTDNFQSINENMRNTYRLERDRSLIFQTNYFKR